MTTPGLTRVRWIDVGRAIAVIAIVLMHYRIWGIAVREDATGGGLRQWRLLSTAFDGIRMPLLFALSGLLAARTLRARPARAGIRRALACFYLVIVWTTIYALLGSLNLASLDPIPGSWQGYLRVLFVPSTTLWFVYALGVYCLVILALRRVPAWVVLALFLAATVFASLGGDNWSLLTWRTVAYGIFFAVGVYGREALMRFAQAPHPAVVAAALALHVISLVAKPALTADPVLELCGFLVRGVSGIIVGVALAVLLARFVPALAAIGRRTLPIYVLHVPLIWLILSTPALQWVLFPSGAKWAWPLLGVTFIVGAALGIHWVIQKTPARVIFAMPSSWIRLRAGEEQPSPSKDQGATAAENPPGPSRTTQR